MLYSEKIKLAMNISYNAHQNQLDKNGYPYFAHPLHLAENMTCENSTIVALLHDVVEDTPLTFDDIVNFGFGDIVVEALKLLTHDKGVNYMDYIEKIKGNDLARKVKVADLKHNLDLSRLCTVTDKDMVRAEKYKTALNILE